MPAPAARRRQLGCRRRFLFGLGFGFRVGLLLRRLRIVHRLDGLGDRGGIAGLAMACLQRRRGSWRPGPCLPSPCSSACRVRRPSCRASTIRPPWPPSPTPSYPTSTVLAALVRLRGGRVQVGGLGRVALDHGRKPHSGGPLERVDGLRVLHALRVRLQRGHGGIRAEQCLVRFHGFGLVRHGRFACVARHRRLMALVRPVGAYASGDQDGHGDGRRADDDPSAVLPRFPGPAPGRGPTESRTASAAVSSSDGTPSFMLFSPSYRPF